MRFLAYDLALDIIRGLQAPLAIVRRQNAALARQGTNAVDSVLLNLAEGNGRDGGDRLHHFRIALGSLREVGAVLDIAAAHGWLDGAPLARERDRLCGMIYGLPAVRPPGPEPKAQRAMSGLVDCAATWSLVARLLHAEPLRRTVAAWVCTKARSRNRSGYSTVRVDASDARSRNGERLAFQKRPDLRATWRETQ